MKRYLLFIFQNYYPNGGMNDFVKDFDSVDEAKNYAQENLHNLVPDCDNFVEIYDTELQEDVFFNSMDYNENNKLLQELKRTIESGKLSAKVAISKLQ